VTFPSTKSPPKVGLPSDDKLPVGRREAAELLSISQRALDYLVANKHLTIPLNSIAVAALKELHSGGKMVKPTPVFPSMRSGESLQGSRG
jgi:hypothetical protein